MRGGGRKINNKGLVLNCRRGIRGRENKEWRSDIEEREGVGRENKEWRSDIEEGEGVGRGNKKWRVEGL